MQPTAYLARVKKRLEKIREEESQLRYLAKIEILRFTQNDKQWSQPICWVTP